MKNLIINTSMVIAFLAIISLSRCTESGPDEKERAEAMLTSGVWSSPIVTVDGVDHSDLYQSFNVQFSKNTYTSSGGSPMWPFNGTWTFTDEDGEFLSLDGDLEIQIIEITETDLELAIQWENSTYSSGRVQSVGGKNIFRLKKM